MKEKILILNGSHSEISIIKAAKNLNYHVITTGSAKSAPGNLLSDEYIEIDYTDIMKLTTLCKQKGIRNIIPNANDFAIKTFIELKKNLDLTYFDSIENLEIIHNKDHFKKLCCQLNIPVPQCFQRDNISYPCIIKPNDNCGGRGITLVREPSQLEHAIETAKSNSADKNIIIEDFIESSLYSFSSFLKERKVVAYFDDQEYTNINPYSVTLSRHPSNLNIKILNSLLSSIEKIADYLSLENGVFHLQFMLKGSTPIILEATRRMSGDLYARPVEIAKKLNWSEMYINGILNKKFELQKPIDTKKNIGRICLLAKENGVLIDIEIQEELRSIIVEEYQALQKGDVISNFKTQRIAVLILDFNLNSKHKFSKIESYYKVKIDKV